MAIRTFIPFFYIILQCTFYSCKEKEVENDIRDQINDYYHPQEVASNAYKKANQMIVREMNDEGADSLMAAAILSARKKLHQDSLIIYYTEYLNLHAIAESNSARAEDVAIKLEELSLAQGTDFSKWKSCKALVGYFIEKKNSSDAIRNCTRLLELANNLDAPEVRAESYISLALSQQIDSVPKDAMRNFLNALYEAEISQNTDCRISIYNDLSYYYDKKNLDSKALEYKTKQIELLKTQKPIDSLRLYHALLNHIDIIFENKNGEINFEKLDEIISFAIRKNYSYLKFYAFAFIRTSLLDKQRFKELKEIYYEKYPEEWNDIRINDTVTYYRLNAHFNDAAGNYDSAFFYFTKMQALIIKAQNNSFSSNYYLRLGKFLLKWNKSKEALNAYEQALIYAEKDKNVEFISKASDHLMQIGARTGNYKLAYENSKRYNAIKDKFDEKNQSEDLLKLEIETESKLIQEENNRKELLITNRHNLQYMLMVVLIAIVFIIMLVMVRFKVPVWVIRSMGFFAFIFLFEYIILRTDHWIVKVTHGEPWKILGIKIILIAILMPLHHWSEKVAIHFLLLRRASNQSLFRLKSYFSNWFNKYNDDKEEDPQPPGTS